MKKLWIGAAFLFSLALTPCLSVAEVAATGAPEASLVLLGTAGGPIIRETRNQPAAMIVINNQIYLIDCGDGAIEQVVRSEHSLLQIKGVFLTHHHQDHTGGLGALIASSWSLVRRENLTIFGPPGTDILTQRILAGLSVSEGIFRKGVKTLPPMASLVDPHDIGGDGPFFDDENIRVIAAQNTHYQTFCESSEPCENLRSYSYRFELKRNGKVIVFTGDTGPSDAVTALAGHADFLVSEIVDIPSIVAMLSKNPRLPKSALEPAIQHMRHEHLAPEAVGTMASHANVKQVILTHFAWGDERRPDADALAAEVRRFYPGEVTAGHDLQVFALD